MAKAPTRQNALDLLEDEEEQDQRESESEQTEDLAQELGISSAEADERFVELPNGDVLVNERPTKTPKEDPEHYANLAEQLDEGVLAGLAQKYLELIKIDIEARQNEDKIYADGLMKTGLGGPAPGGASFTGASKVTHPVLLEACLDFSAMAIREIVPPTDIVRTNIKGKPNKDKLERADRKAQFMNWQLSEQMVEYREEKEAELTQLSMGGSQYMKLWFDQELKRPACQWVPVDHIILPYASQSFYSAPRVTELEQVTDDTMKNRIDQGMYRSIDGILEMVDELRPEMESDDDKEYTMTDEESAKIEGKVQTDQMVDGNRKLYHVYTWIRLDADSKTKGKRAPYLMTFDEDENVWGLWRNWASGDDTMTKLDWIVEDKFIPWRGSRGIGLPQIIGGLSAAAIGALRALLDSAHFQNAQTGFMIKGGATGESLEPQPGQIIELPSGEVEDIRKHMMALPYPPPSPVLYQLLEFLTNAAKGVVSTSEEKIQDLPANVSATQVLNLVESGGRVVSSIHARLHRAQERFLRILARINANHLSEMVNESGVKIEVKDFMQNNDVCPISDPHIFSETQRVNQAQAVLQMALAAPPGTFEMRAVIKQVLQSMKIPYADEILPDEEGEVESNPALENVKMALGKPSAVYPDQDHLAHMQTHLAFATDKNYGANPLIAPQYAPVLLQHLKQHFILHYLQSMRDTVKQDADGEDIFDLHVEKSLSVLEQQAIALTALEVQDRSQVLFETYMPLIGEIQKKVSEAAQNRQQQAIMADPASGALLAVEKQKMQFETENAKAKFAQEKEALQTKHQQEIAKLETKIAELMAKSSDDERIQAMKDQTAIAISALNNDSKERIEEIKLGAAADAQQLQMEHERSQAEVAGLREAQNLADSHANAMEAQGAQNQADLQQAQASAPELPPPEELAPEPPEPQLSPVAPPPTQLAAGGLMGNFMKNELAGGDLAKQQVVDKLNGGTS